MESMGLDTAFIDYRNRIEELSLGKTATFFLKRRQVVDACKTAIRNAMGYRSFALRGFKEFHRCLPKTEKRYEDREQLNDIDCDVLAVGSDQVWNPSISGSLDPAFLLGFGHAKKRLSVASSMGNHVVTDPNESSLLRGSLCSFSGVSVREFHTKQQVDRIAGVDSYLCPDPTLMLESAIWRDFAKKPKDVEENAQYLLVFTLNTRSKEEEEAWRRYSKSMGLPVYRIINNRYRGRFIDRNLHGVTPWEFVWLIDHARFVCTDSYHGTAFSVALQTPFALFPSKTGNNVRMNELLEETKLRDRSDNLDGEMVAQVVDFHFAAEVLRKRRSEALEWLSAVLGGLNDGE
ncbi:polysaccharide pyruvyl transferase family protein [Gordonibacter massiliensis]|nr:polysaccharide pyruvyl transferase family protein [Gordonibacter massiliensis (ex Traore et al. 2017)]